MTTASKTLLAEDRTRWARECEDAGHPSFWAPDVCYCEGREKS